MDSSTAVPDRPSLIRANLLVLHAIKIGTFGSMWPCGWLAELGQPGKGHICRPL